MKKMTKTAIGIGIATLMGLAGAQGNVLLEFNANNDTDPNDGWDFTGAISGTLPVNLTAGGVIQRLVDPGATQHYYQRDGGARGFGPSLGGSVSFGDYSLETWVRRDEIGPSEDFVFQLKNSSFSTTFLIAKAREANPPEELDFIHQAPAGERSTNLNQFQWSLDEWQHWVFTYQEASSVGADDGVLTIVVNNGTPIVLTGQKPRYTGAPAVNTAEIFYSGSEWDRGMRGDIALIRLHDEVLDGAAIAASYNQGYVDLNIPEPGSLALLVCGAGMLAAVRRRIR
jgi:hypothetical protein